MVAGKEAAVVESVKAASEVYAPVAGDVVEVNEALADDPALVNRDPQGEDGSSSCASRSRASWTPFSMRPLTRNTARACTDALSAPDRGRPPVDAATIGVPSVDSLFRDVPESGPAVSPDRGAAPVAGEMEVERTIVAMAAKNISAGSVPSFRVPALTATTSRRRSIT